MSDTSRLYYDPARSAKESASPSDKPWIAPYLTGDPKQTDDVTALARMLASEDAHDPGAQVVIGWITVQRAKRAGWTLYKFITRGQGYGPGPDTRPGVHASTAKPPTPATIDLARDLILGTVQPSAAIRAVKPGSWFERKQGPKDSSLINSQKRWEERAWARLASHGQLTNWVLYSAEKAPLVMHEGQTATEALDGLPTVEALDQTSYPGRQQPPLVA